LKTATSEKLGRLDLRNDLREKILPLCRLKKGDVWEDEISGHKVGVLDATEKSDVIKIMNGNDATLAVNDPPYNVAVGNVNTANLSKLDMSEYLIFSEKWIKNVVSVMAENSHFYLWSGAEGIGVCIAATRAIGASKKLNPLFDI